jgi:heat shock protein HslJ
MTRFPLLLPLLLAACASAPAPLPPPDAEVRPVVAQDRLEGRWTITAVNGRAVTGLQLELTPTSANYSLGCNSGGGIVARNGDKLFIDQAALSERGCAPAIMQVEAQAITILRRPMTMECTPPARLRLINEAGTLELVRYQRVG